MKLVISDISNNCSYCENCKLKRRGEKALSKHEISPLLP